MTELWIPAPLDQCTYISIHFPPYFNERGGKSIFNLNVQGFQYQPVILAA